MNGLSNWNFGGKLNTMHGFESELGNATLRIRVGRVDFGVSTAKGCVSEIIVTYAD